MNIIFMAVIERNFERNIGIINPEPYEKEYYLFKVENKESFRGL